MTVKNMPRTHPLLLNAVDRLGRPIEPCVLSVAQEIASQAISYAQKSLADPCVTMNLLEEATATVSITARAKEAADLPPIQALRAYLYLTFLRRVSGQRETEIRLEEAFEDHFRLNKGMSFEEKLEARFLL